MNHQIDKANKIFTIYPVKFFFNMLSSHPIFWHRKSLCHMHLPEGQVDIQGRSDRRNSGLLCQLPFNQQPKKIVTNSASRTVKWIQIGVLVKIWIKKSWGKAWDSAFLISSQVLAKPAGRRATLGAVRLDQPRGSLIWLPIRITWTLYKTEAKDSLI